MLVSVKLTSPKKEEIEKFLSQFYNTSVKINEKSHWSQEYRNPIEISDIIGVYIDNIENFNLNMWINLDKDIFIKITEKNANNIIKYLFERYPY